MGGMLGLVSTALTTAMGAAGQYREARAQSAGLEAQAEADRLQARIAETRAATAADQSRLAGAREAEAGYRQQGRQRAQLAQAGLLNSPTGLLLLEEGQELARQREMEAGEAGRREALNYQLQRSQDLTSAALTSARARQARRAGALGAATAILSGVSRGYGGLR